MQCGLGLFGREGKVRFLVDANGLEHRYGRLKLSGEKGIPTGRQPASMLR
jgi:hypothetical protein